MAFQHLFTGNAMGAVGVDGRVSLPQFITRGLDGGAAGQRIIVGAHDEDACLKAYQPAHAVALLAEAQRRKLRDEAAGEPAGSHYRRARRAFGFAEEALVDAQGRLTLPPMMRRKGMIAERALFIGTGDSFEIWDPQTARETGDESLREIAEYRLGAAQ